MILRRGECDTEERRVCYWGEESVIVCESVILRRGECVTEERRV